MNILETFIAMISLAGIISAIGYFGLKTLAVIIKEVRR